MSLRDWFHRPERDDDLDDAWRRRREGIDNDARDAREQQRRTIEEEQQTRRARDYHDDYERGIDYY